MWPHSFVNNFSVYHLRDSSVFRHLFIYTGFQCTKFQFFYFFGEKFHAIVCHAIWKIHSLSFMWSMAGMFCWNGCWWCDAAVPPSPVVHETQWLYYQREKLTRTFWKYFIYCLCHIVQMGPVLCTLNQLPLYISLCHATTGTLLGMHFASIITLHRNRAHYYGNRFF